MGTNERINIMITYNVLPDDPIEITCMGAINLSKFLCRKVSFEFNGIQMFAEPHSIFSELIQQYRSKSERS